ncbi:MAG: hypothetical protein JXB36_17370 [Gammaproteobacteria bacterium]|nr:hypothetical protein [Gammaproteobacteria bacterium]
MSTDGEVIALVLADGGEPRHAGPSAQGAKRLVRDQLGRISLEEVATQEEFDRAARQTGCFRRGKPIVDPETRDVIGYEMEEVPIYGPGRA